jgi:hypothetical protein
MGDNISSTVTSNMGPALRAVQALKAKFAELGVVIRNAGNQANTLAKKVITAGNIGKAGQSLSKAGGAAGGFGSNVLGSFGISGTFGRIAVAAGLAAVAARTFLAVQEANLDRTRKTIDAEKQLGDARERGRKEIEKQARAGEAQAPLIRKVFGIGGEGAVNLVDSVTKGGLVNQQDASEGILLALKEFDRQDVGQVVNLANELVAVGGNFTEVIKEFSKGPKDIAGIYGSQTRVARDLLGANTSTDYEVEKLLQRRLRASASNRYLESTRNATGIRSQEAGIERDRATTESVGLAKTDLAKARDPVSASLVELNITQSQQLQAMERMVASQNQLYVWFQSKFGTGVVTELRRTQNAQADAAFAGGG